MSKDNILYFNPGYDFLFPHRINFSNSENCHNKFVQSSINLYNSSFDRWIFNNDENNALTNIHELYINYDIWEDKYKNSIAHIRCNVKNDKCVNISFGLNKDDRSFYIDVTKKDNTTTRIGKIENVLFCFDYLYNVKIHIYYDSNDLSTHITVLLNDDKTKYIDVSTREYLIYKTSDSYITNVCVCKCEYNYKFSNIRNISNIILSTTDLTDKQCVEFPIKLMANDTTWKKKTDGTYVSDKNGDAIKYQIDMDKLKTMVDWYDNTSIDAIMLGSLQAYSYGNNSVAYSVNDTQYDEEALANQDYYGNASKIMLNNPSKNSDWTEEELSKAIFTITNKIK